MQALEQSRNNREEHSVHPDSLQAPKADLYRLIAAQKVMKTDLAWQKGKSAKQQLSASLHIIIFHNLPCNLRLILHLLICEWRCFPYHVLIKHH